MVFADKILLFILLCMLPVTVSAQNWYEKSFYLMHLDHHTQGEWEVGRDADPDETARLISLSRPDVIQIHAKGNPGWTTYPTKIGYTPYNLKRDVMDVWRQVADRLQVPFSAYYNFGRDGCLMENRPEFNRMKQNGELYERRLCYNSGVEKAYLWPMIREIIVNYHPEGFWFDGSCFTVDACFCEKCKLYFKTVYGKEPPESNESPDWELYKEMQRELYRNSVHETIKIIHEIDPECLVAFNFAYSMHMPEKPDEGIAYLSGDIAGRIDRLSVTGRFYDTQGKPFDLMTPIWNRTENGQVPKRLEHQQQEIAVIIANGGRFFAWDNPTRESGLNESRQAFLGTVAPWMRERQEFCLNTVRIADASVLVIAEAHYANYRNATSCFRQDNPRVYAASNSLVKQHILHDVTADWRLKEGLIDSKVIILENPEAVPADVVQSLDTFVRKGGTLFVTGKAPYSGGEPVCDLLGIKTVSRGNEAQSVQVLSGKDVISFTSDISRINPVTAQIILSASLKENAETEIPFLTKKTRGKGLVYYCAVPFFSLDDNSMLPEAFVIRILNSIFPEKARTVITAAPQTIETTLRKKGNHRILHLVNRAAGEEEGTSYALIRKNIPKASEVHISLALSEKPTAVSIEPGGKKLSSWKYTDGRFEIDCPDFAIHQMIVITMPG